MRFAPIAAVAALSLATIATPSVAAGDALGSPTATVVLTAKSADIGVGYTWGDATLTYNHKKYHFSVTGGTIAAVGYSEATGKGTVYNLHRAEDFAGTYAAAAGEATLGEGIGGKVLENKNGVRIKIEMASKGARLAAAASGITFTLKQ
ncbi:MULTISPECIES: hypothetical protein [Acetobacter]|uniref:DUF1134 domain-containing protein n=1 Tax=Acetobacter sacchari TaxID=2661687 RepID=A0ABS3LR91_9PROT|nr:MULTISPECIES: hypothetical protein [Acetobacter]MBO1358421.1 hypothetical protein [Acetobacter sacchari]OUJ15611.1 hypothetical protein HK28_07490 [Acetobacter sp. DsW_063]